MLKIYKIVDNTNGNVYIGKTEEKYLCDRLSSHNYDYKRGYNCSSCKIIKNGDYKIELIEETEDETRERYWILNTECVNKQIPGRTKKEWYQDNKINIKNNSRKYYQDHRKDKLEKLKEYNKNNKDKIKEYKKELYKYQKLWGDSTNNLLKIDPNLFLV